MYSLSILKTGEILSSGEDRSVRIWTNSKLSQTIVLPCLSVWSVAGSPSGDIFAAGSDGQIRVFSRNSDRFALPGDLQAFDLLVASSDQLLIFNTRKTTNSLDKQNIEGPEALSGQGRKEGEVKMVRVGAMVEAYQVQNLLTKVEHRNSYLAENWGSSERSWE